MGRWRIAPGKNLILLPVLPLLLFAVAIYNAIATLWRLWTVLICAIVATVVWLFTTDKPLWELFIEALLDETPLEILDQREVYEDIARRKERIADGDKNKEKGPDDVQKSEDASDNPASCSNTAGGCC